MGNDMQLREDNLMTKIMLKEQDQVIQHIEEERMDFQLSINQMGDTILHYAAYHSLKKLIQYLLDKGSNPHQTNNRGLSPIDVALPQIREWIIQKHLKNEEQRQKARYSPKNKDRRKESVKQSIIIANHMNKP